MYARESGAAIYHYRRTALRLCSLSLLVNFQVYQRNDVF